MLVSISGAAVLCSCVECTVVILPVCPGGGFEYLSEGFEDTSHDISSIALAFYDGLWAYDGW